MAITELVIAEAQHLATIQRVANALNRTLETAATSGRKESATIRTLVNRWSDLLKVHAKFHDDVVAVNEDLRETARLINCMLVTLEPTLVDHARDLSNALKKLIRRDQNLEHTFAEWNSALRQPFEHLVQYDEWLVIIDPQMHFCEDYRSQLHGLIYKIKMVTEANQHPKNMLRRLSTIAKTVISKRRSSQQLLILPSTPETPTMDEYGVNQHNDGNLVESPSTTAASTPIDKNGNTTFLPASPKTIQELDIAEYQQKQQHYEQQPQQPLELEAVMEPVSPSEGTAEKDLPPCPPTKVAVTDIYLETTVTFNPNNPNDRRLSILSVSKQLPHRSSAASDLSSAGTLTAGPPSPLFGVPASGSMADGVFLASSASSIRSKTSSSGDTVMVRQHSSLARQKFLHEKEARKATLRVGISETIQARADKLQSPTFTPTSSSPHYSRSSYGIPQVARSSIDSLRVSPTKVETENKPPVKSLISFWEQVSEPTEV
ncbi:hypothetical protein BGZ83_011808 [Gryganskiella cystojenkinii]|nr:hypothetical protein BGZ83_011808 [Gryganskiella cystojenkinii]